MKTYKKGDSRFLSKNFRAREFDCPGKTCCKKTKVDTKLVKYLQNIREHFGKPVEILAYRCKTYNGVVPNAAKNSYHTKGKAADFHIDGVAPLEIARYAESIGIKGIGLYEDFVHIDTRTKKFFWRNHSQSPESTFAEKPSLEAVARDVIQGKYGAGETRKKKLKAAGFDPVAVQKQVNILLGGGK